MGTCLSTLRRSHSTSGPDARRIERGGVRCLSGAFGHVSRGTHLEGSLRERCGCAARSTWDTDAAFHVKQLHALQTRAARFRGRTRAMFHVKQPPPPHESRAPDAAQIPKEDRSGVPRETAPGPSRAAALLCGQVPGRTTAVFHVKQLHARPERLFARENLSGGDAFLQQPTQMLLDLVKTPRWRPRTRAARYDSTDLEQRRPGCVGGSRRRSTQGGPERSASCRPEVLSLAFRRRA